MNIFHAFTRRCLKENKTRTLVTIIGIVLSMSLFTAVIEGAYSGMQYLVRGVIADEGNWAAYEMNASETEIDGIASDKRIKSYVEWTEVGWGDIDSDNEYKPYILVESMGEGFTDLVRVHLTDGRMPKNENEILIPSHLSSNGGVTITTGSVIDLTLGRRTTLDERLIQRNSEYTPGEEKISWTFDRTYTVVGHYIRFDSVIEGYSSPGYVALTVGDAKGPKDVFFELKNIRAFLKMQNEELYFNRTAWHGDLLHMSGVTGTGSINAAIGGFAFILVALVFFGSISLIYNSFSISVSERTKLFGILKSVGATKKQIRETVTYEALVLAGIGIPIGMIVGCLGIGITLYALRDSFGGFYGGIYADTPPVQMKLVLNPWALLLAAAVCLITTLVSARRPARRAIRISPIESIRQTEDVNIKKREVKTSKLTQKLFGFEGMMASKNFKRNKRRYRSVVLSLFMSVVLFITASSFCTYLKNAVLGVTGYNHLVDIEYSIYGWSTEETKKLLDELSAVPGVTDSYMVANTYGQLSFKETDLTDEILDTDISDYYYGPIEEGNKMINVDYVFLTDEKLTEYCEMSGVDPKEIISDSDPKGLLVNKYMYYGQKTVKLPVIKEDKFPVIASISDLRSIEGYSWMTEITGDDGTVYACFMPEDYASNYWQTHDYVDKDLLDMSLAKLIPQSEAYEKTYIKIGAVAGKEVADLRNNTTIILPLSAAEKIFGEKAESLTYGKYLEFNTTNHTAVYNSMRALLTEKGLDTRTLFDQAEELESTRMMVTVINVFAYGFIILISLIALANVFNTISTNVMLRRREYAMLKSVGMDSKGFNKMSNYECIIYGLKGLSFGLPVSVLTTYFVYRVAYQAFETDFYIPVASFGIAILSVFIVVFATMMYSMRKIKNDNPIDALKNENL